MGLTITLDADGYQVWASDPELSTARRVRDLRGLALVIGRLKKRNPGKAAAILVPAPGVTVADLMKVVIEVRSEFPDVVLSAGQRIRL